LDNSTLIALVAAVFTLLGASVSSVFGYYALKKQDDRRFEHTEEEQRKLHLKRRATAYRRLQGIAEQVMNQSNFAEPSRFLTIEQYETIQSIIAQDSDVLDDSTVAAWDTRSTSFVPHEGGNYSVNVLCAAFWPEVKKHYDAIKFSAILPSS
jgi:hypothetical protein